MADLAELVIRTRTDGVDKVTRDLMGVENAAQQVTRQIQQMLQPLQMMQNLVAMAGIGLGIRQLIEYADAWKMVEGRLKLVTFSTAQLITVQQQLFDMAQRTRQGFEQSAELYGRMARSTQQLGVSQKDLLQVTESINKAVLISGGNAASASAALFQLGQAMSSGVLRGEELNSVLEQTPRLAQAIAEGLGKSIGQLRAMGAAGQLSSQAVIDALKKSAGVLDMEFSKIPVTVSAATQTISNSMLRFVGKLDEASGSSKLLTGVLVGMSSAFDSLANSAGVVANVIGVGLLSQVVPMGIKGFSALKAGIGDYIHSLDQAAIKTLELAKQEQMLAAATLVARQKEAATASAQVGPAVATASAAARTAAAAEADALVARSNVVKAEQAKNIYMVNAALAQEREALLAVTMATEASVAADQAKAAALAKSAAATTAVTEANTALTIASQGATAATVAHAEATTFLGRSWASLKGLGSGLLAMVGGPWGAAFLAAAAGLYALATRETEAEKATRLFTEAQIAANKHMVEQNDTVKSLIVGYNQLTLAQRKSKEVDLEEGLKKQTAAIEASQQAVLAASMKAQRSIGAMGLFASRSELGQEEGLGSTFGVDQIAGLRQQERDKLVSSYLKVKEKPNDVAALSEFQKILNGLNLLEVDGKRVFEILSKEISPFIADAQQAEKQVKLLGAALAFLKDPSEANAESLRKVSNELRQGAQAVSVMTMGMEELIRKTALLSVPKGFKRDLAAFLQQEGVPLAAQTAPVKPEALAKNTADAEEIRNHTIRQKIHEEGMARFNANAVKRDVGQKTFTTNQNELLQEEIRTTALEIANKRLLASVIGEVDKNSAESRIELMKMAQAKKDMSEADLLNIVTSKDFASVLAQLPKDLQDYYAAIMAVKSADHSGQINKTVALYQAETEGVLKLVDAHKLGAAAVEEQRIANEAHLEGMRQTEGTEADIFRRRMERLQAERKERLEGELAQRQQADEVNRAVLGAISQGPIAENDARLKAQARQQAMTYGRDGTAAYNNAYKRLLESAAKGADTDRQIEASRSLKGQADEVGQLQAEREALTMTNIEREKSLAIYKATVEARKMWKDVNSAEAQQYIQTAGAIAEYRAAMEKAGAIAGEVASTVTDSIEKMLDGTKSLKDTLAELPKALGKIALRENILKPFEQLLKGSLTQLMSPDVPKSGGGLPLGTDTNPMVVTIKGFSGGNPTPTVGGLASGVSGSFANTIAGGPGNDSITGGGALTADRVVSFFQQRGMSRNQAIGIAANLQAESDFNIRAVGDGGRSHGLAQWNGDRLADFRTWAGVDMQQSTAEQQLGFINYELQGSEQRAGRALSATSTPAAAAMAFATRYERPANALEAGATRADLANDIARRLTEVPASAGAPSTSFADAMLLHRQVSGLAADASSGSPDILSMVGRLNQLGGSSPGGGGNIFSRLGMFDSTGGNPSAWLDNFGYSNFGIGTMLSGPGTAVPAGMANATSVSQFAAAMPAGPAGATELPATFSGGLGAGLGAGFGGGMIGGQLGGMIGTATNSKALGAVSGAALGGLGAIGMGMMMGAAAGPVGIIAGAIIGGIMGMMGTSKASVGPNANANTATQNGRFIFNGAGQDNGGDSAEMAASIRQFNKQMNALVDTYSLRVGDFHGGLDSGLGGADHTPQELLRRILRGDTITGTGAVGTMLANASQNARNSNTIEMEDFAKALEFAQKLQDATDSLAHFATGIDGVREAAQQTIASPAQLRQMQADMRTANENGLGAQFTATTTTSSMNQIRNLTDTSEFGSASRAIATLRGQIAGLRAVTEAAGGTFDQGTADQLFVVWQGRQRDNTVRALQNQMGGVGAASNRIFELQRQRDMNRGDLLATGADPALADQNYARAVEMIVRGIRSGAGGTGEARDRITALQETRDSNRQLLASAGQDTALADQNYNQSITQIVRGIQNSGGGIGANLNTLTGLIETRDSNRQLLASAGMNGFDATNAFESSVRSFLAGLDQATRDIVVQRSGSDVQAVAGRMSRGFSTYQTREQQAGMTTRDANAILSGYGSQAEQVAATRRLEDMQRQTQYSAELNAAVDGATRSMIEHTQRVEGDSIQLRRHAEDMQRNIEAGQRTAGLAVRALNAIGNTREATLLQLSQTQGVELQAAQQRGENTTVMGMTQQAERDRASFESYRSDLVEVLNRDIETRQHEIAVTERQTGWIVRLSTTMRDAANNAMLGQSSPLGPEAQLIEARRLFEQALTRFNDTTLPQAERERQAGLVQSYGGSLMSISRGYYGSGGSSEDFDHVMSVWRSIGGMTEDQVDTARISLARQQEFITNQQEQIRIANQMGQRAIGSIDDLRTSAVASLHTLEASVGRLQPFSTSNLYQGLFGGANQGNLESLMGQARGMGSDAVFNLLTSANQNGVNTGAYAYHPSSTAQSLYGVLNDSQRGSIASQIGFTGYSGSASDSRLNSYIAAYGRSSDFESLVQSNALNNIGSMSTEQLELVRAMVANSNNQGYQTEFNNRWGTLHPVQQPAAQTYEQRLTAMTPEQRYLDAYPDVARSQFWSNPAEHYAEYGAREGRDSFGMSLSREQQYLVRYSDVAKDDFYRTHPYQHYMDAGRAEGRTFARGGMIPIAGGGRIGNGAWNVDSVLARYAGGGNIALAGGEFIVPAAQTTRYLPQLEAMRAGAYGHANDDGYAAVCAELRLQRDQNERLMQRLLALTEAAAEANVDGHAGTAVAVRSSRDEARAA